MPLSKKLKQEIKLVALLTTLLSFYYFAIFDKHYPYLLLALMAISIVFLFFAIIKGNLSKNMFLNVRKHEWRVLFFVVVNAILLVVVMVSELEFDYKNLWVNILFLVMKAVFVIEIILSYLINFSKLQEPALADNKELL